MDEEWKAKLRKVSVLTSEERHFLIVDCGHLEMELSTFDYIARDLMKFWEKNYTDEEKFLKKLKDAPDGFPKAWGYAMYGAFKAMVAAHKTQEGRCQT